MNIKVDLKIKMNPSGSQAVLRSPGVIADLERRAANIADAAGPGHSVDSQDGPHRSRAAVITRTEEAKAAEAKDRNLTRAFDAGRR